MAGLTPIPSEVVDAPRAAECPVQMEATLAQPHRMAADDGVFEGFVLSMEVRIERLHLEESLLRDGNPDRIDSDAWRPLIMSFAHFYGLDDGKVEPSELARIPERLYPRAGAGDTRSVATA